MPRGTASSARSTLSRKSPHVPATIASVIAMLTSGSIQEMPVSRIRMPATTTPAEIAASAAMWRNAPRTFASRCPRMKSRAVIVLMMTPIAATAITVGPATGSGARRRWIASQRIAPQAVSKSTALARAA